MSSPSTVEKYKFDRVWDYGELYTRPRQIGKPVLWTEGITLRFGGVTALDGVSVEVRRGEILGIIGPNGAGKTSLLNVITGVYKPQKGKVYFKGRDITGLRPHQRTLLGISRTFQHSELFHGMTVLENIMVRLHPWTRGSIIEKALWAFRAKRWEVEARERAEHVIDLLDLHKYRHSPIGSLPPGIQKKVDLAGALAQNPEVVLMDEPMAGLSKEEKEDIVRAVIETSETMHTTMVLIEHDMEVVTDICDRVVVMDYGKVIFEGPPHEAVADERVRKAYLGE
ncbi:ABC transporter ATP-binding protein [Aeropyrum camini]|uniref:Probable branched-chain amino acid transport ATP-binding protein LivG n=2 Tax=Aeropyrum camini TaxID=229980 RepID=U3T9T5_9CREN|nr:ABC transporter ATP-binding protein [Aeropyrum camini]BAN90297.1 ABC transporter ATP-binding protein [Aeropyrum camini SY1 = JCM 12091]